MNREIVTRDDTMEEDIEDGCFLKGNVLCIAVPKDWPCGRPAVDGQPPF
jgi:hypothetical protein